MTRQTKTSYHFRLSASKGAPHGPPAMHAFKGKMKQNYDGQRSMLYIGAELNLGDKFESPVILKHNII